MRQYKKRIVVIVMALVTAKDMNPEISGAITREYEYTILVGDTLPQ